jgi:hypothetical protein
MQSSQIQTVAYVSDEGQSRILETTAIEQLHPVQSVA